MNKPINLDYKTIFNLNDKLRFEDNLKKCFEKANIEKENNLFIPIFYVHDEIIIVVPINTLGYLDETKIHNKR